MRPYHKTPAIVSLALILLVGAEAWAADPVTARAGAARITPGPKPSNPTPMVKRGMILPPRMLDVYFQPYLERPVGVDATRIAPTLGALWGIVPNFHADLQITPFYYPQGTAGPGRIALTGRLVKTPQLEFGVSFTTLFDPTTPRFLSYFQPGMGAILKPDLPVRIDTGVQLPVYTSPQTHFGIRVPVNVYFQLTNRIHFGATSALFIADLDDPQKTASIPLGITAGYSAGPELEFAAFTPYISWTNFYTPGTGAVDTRSFVAGIIADVAFELP